MTVLEINKLLRSDKPIVAIYVIDGVERQGRIIRARNSGGILQGKVLGTGRWATLKSAVSVWCA